MRAALAAGWRRSDLWWERLQERANHNWRQGRRVAASRGFRKARWLAELAFPRDDPRRATSLANAAFAARARGAHRTAARLYDRALALWAGVPAQAEGLAISPRARSSLHHLRLEGRHAETYRANARARIGRLAAETAACLEALAGGVSPPHRLHARWRGEKPAAFGESRKVIAACLLLATDDG